MDIIAYLIRKVNLILNIKTKAAAPCRSPRFIHEQVILFHQIADSVAEGDRVVNRQAFNN